MEPSTHRHIDPLTYPKTRPLLLMEGGPFYRLERRAGLIKANTPFTIRRALLAAGLTWFVLLILSALHGDAFGKSVTMPFLSDFSTYSRFLIAVPLFLLAEVVLGPRIADTAEHLLLANIVTESDYNKFDAAVERSLRLRDSVFAEIIIVVLAYIVSLTGFRQLAVPISTWYATPSATGGFVLTWAGWWFILFCVPLLQFLLLRWVWRIFLWFRFLNEVSNLNLQLFPTHPDQEGGLGFIGEAQRFFGILFFAYSCSITGVFADEIIYGKIPLQNFAPAIAAYVIFVVLLTSAPLVVFTRKLLVTKRIGLREYGALATAYTGSFHHKWVQGDNPEQQKLLGTPDIQSLADLSHSYEIIEHMKPIPIDPRTLLQLVILTLLPMATLLLTVMPLKDVLKLLMKVVV
ncbi:hypothetical protein [Edaphobacter modestus]|uniref:Uncharacterized protein n=1 Tax=Edaphobacter modestus TaxID=388466 RepID=A0A4Q7Z0Q0_9BACT|nr:hypothetical protein [Edaphobacter modestus]RZU43049.1 hypothetical protein BDD14_4658 [Edaphobacter modestus]